MKLDMNSILLGLIVGGAIGSLIGANLGLILYALMFVSSRSDDEGGRRHGG